MAFFHQLQFGFLRSTRARLLLLVLFLVIPALGVQLFGAWVELRQNIDEQESESLRLLNHAQNDFSLLMNDTHAAFTELVRVNDMRSSDNSPKCLLPCALPMSALLRM